MTFNNSTNVMGTCSNTVRIKGVGLPIINNIPKMIKDFCWLNVDRRSTLRFKKLSRGKKNS